MRLKSLKKENVVSIIYNFTYKCGWQRVINFIKTIIDLDFKKDGEATSSEISILEINVGFMAGSKGENKTQELIDANYDVENCSFAQKESGWVSVSGHSHIMGVNFKFTVWNQLDQCLVECEDLEMFEKYGERVLDKYMDSLEINCCVSEALKYERQKHAKEINEILNKDDDSCHSNSMQIKCIGCGHEFEYNNVSGDVKTFYCACPKCGMELKRGNSNYIEKQVGLMDRERLINAFKLPNDIRKASKEEQIKMLCNAIAGISNELKNVKTDSASYELSFRQNTTRNNVLNEIRNARFLDAYYEIIDFLDDYGDGHKGKVFEIEKREIENLLTILLNSIKQ